MRDYSVAHIWGDGGTRGLMTAVWPQDPWSRRPIAPLDLHLGHVLELSTWHDGVRAVQYGCVADTDAQRMVLVAAGSASEAILMASRAVDLWGAAQLAATEAAWQRRIDASTRFSDEAV